MRTLSMMIALAVLAGAAQAELVYEVRAGGHDLGRCRLTLEVDETGGAFALQGHAKTKLRAKALFVTVFSLDSEERWTRDGEGLRSYASQTEMDGDEMTVAVERTGDALAIEVTAEGRAHHEKVPLESFDLTSAESAGRRLRDGAGEVVLRILDLDELEIVATSFEALGEETLDVDDVAVPCRVYRVQAGERVGRRWYALHGAALLIKDEGEDEDGDYRFELKRIPEEWEAVLSGRNEE